MSEVISPMPAGGEGNREPGTAGQGQQETQPRSPGHMALIIGGMLLSGLVLPIVVTIVTQDLNSSPHIDGSAAHAFLSRYFSDVTTSKRRWYAYEHELTSNFRTFPGNDWGHFRHFWQTQHGVTVDSLIPVAGNPVEYTISLDYKSKYNHTIYTEKLNVWLACDSNYVLARLPWGGCKADNLEIDGTQDASGGTGGT